MVISSSLPGWPAARIRRVLAGLPPAQGYRLEVKLLRYRTRPHLAGLCDYETRSIVVQVPEPFRPFRERIAYRARRLGSRRGRGVFAFRWFYRTVLFRTRAEVIRYLYCHEFYHYYLHEVLGRAGSAETACDRFALQYFRRRQSVRLNPAPAR
ncbi:MAG: hypothetical protein QN173_07380 [Armatimonadota bacterium]|nr:hypothetical protein [Armatimonadota bacterium]MDR7404502.1 hypothetical protein [Armatimonadota bacterium]MDR7437997.1 hypothetical protein [Armatimonadota bacterium]MDR7473079.1 hypothetical protein [Armatimonadota bacterium]MDR7507407.1 hypothetical protein [Armatimonadota bacterium]